MKKFTIKIISVSAILALIGALVFGLIIPQFYLPVLPFVLVFFMLITLSVHAWQLNLAKKDIAKFARNNMLITFLKLVIYSAFAIVYIAIDRENALVFVICLMIIYLIFTFIEVVEISGISRKSKN